MQLRRAFAIGIAVLVLCGSSLASICELNCSLPRSCHQPTAPTPASQTGQVTDSSIHSHCGNAMMQMSDAAKFGLENRSSCSAGPCCQSAEFSSPTNARDIAVQTITGQFAAPACFFETAGGGHDGLVKRKGSQLQIIPFESFTVMLRI